MGQPLGHSLRVAQLAGQLARARRADPGQVREIEQVALLRWSGCTANADGFAHLLGDDVDGRRAMLDGTLNADDMNAVHKAAPLAVVHCEVASEIARTLELGAAVQTALSRVFETFDGSGRPMGLTHEHIPEAAYLVVLAGDLDILSRAHGVEAALAWIGEQADRRYPADLANLLVKDARQWLAALDGMADEPGDADSERPVCLSLVGDVIDLKLPWLAGHSRQVAHVATEAARLWVAEQAGGNRQGRAYPWPGPGGRFQPRLEYHRAVAVRRCRACAPGAVLDAKGDPVHPRTEHAGRDRCPCLRTSRRQRLLPGARAEALCVENRLLATAVAWVALRGTRPWRTAHGEADAARLLKQDARRGLFDEEICEAVIAAARGERTFTQPRSALLTPRECRILLEISQGASNKEVARNLAISPSTVRTHMESIFRKLGCSTRAAATLKGLTLGLIA